MSRSFEKLDTIIRPEIQGIQSYEPESAVPSIRMDANESPFDVSEELKTTILDGYNTKKWQRYPDPNCLELREAIAAFEGIAVDQIVVGNGSDEIIRDLLLAFGGAGTKTVFPSPTFSMYRLLTLITGGTPMGIPLQENWTLDTGAMVKAVASEHAHVVFLASPNNPTGNRFSDESLREVCDAAKGLVVIDEAYRMFAGESLKGWLKDYPNLIILNTYSKAMSLAGIRIGYMMAGQDIIEVINKIRLPYNMDSFAQWAALKAIEQPQLWQAQAEQVKAERKRVVAALSTIDKMQVYPSDANFVLIRFDDASRLKEKLGEKNIAIRGFSQPEQLKDCLRITIGKPEENTLLIEGINALMRR